MTPSRTALLAYLDADPAHTLAGYEGASFDIPKDVIDGNAITRAVLVRWADAIVESHPAAASLIGLLTAYHTYGTINPGDPRFVAAMPSLQVAGLISAGELATFNAMGSQRVRDGWTAPPTDADVAAARAEQAQEQAAAALAAAKLAKNLEIDADRNRQVAPITAQREARIAAVLAAATVDAVNAIVVGE